MAGVVWDHATGPVRCKKAFFVMQRCSTGGLQAARQAAGASTEGPSHEGARQEPVQGGFIRQEQGQVARQSYDTWSERAPWAVPKAEGRCNGLRCCDLHSARRVSARHTALSSALTTERVGTDSALRGTQQQKQRLANSDGRLQAHRAFRRHLHTHRTRCLPCVHPCRVGHFNFPDRFEHLTQEAGTR